MGAPAVLESRGISLLAYHDHLEGSPGFKLAMQQQGARWFLYVGHLCDRGWSILDVTDPIDPRFENFIEGPQDTWTLQLRVAEGTMVTALQKLVPIFGVPEEAPYEEGALIWNVGDDPVRPRLLGHDRTGGRGTHRDFYSGGRFALRSDEPLV